MAERQHWIARWIDWARRGHWLWSVFPSSGKAVIWGLIVGGTGTLIAFIGNRPAIHGWIVFLSSILVYALIWAIVQTTGIWTKRLSVGAGTVTAYGEVRHPFQTSASDPRITIDFDKSPQPMLGLSIRPIRLRNVGGTDAYKVQVQTIALGAGYAEFREIPQLRRDQSDIVEVRILDPSTREPFTVHDLEILLEAEANQRRDAEDWDPLEVKCSITYRDYAERHFITHFTLSRDVAKDLTSAKDYKFFELRLAKARCPAVLGHGSCFKADVCTSSITYLLLPSERHRSALLLRGAVRLACLHRFDQGCILAQVVNIFPRHGNAGL
jgi:hypothetical protein